jgi:hypothetical protein
VASALALIVGGLIGLLVFPYSTFYIHLFTLQSSSRCAPLCATDAVRYFLVISRVVHLPISARILVNATRRIVAVILPPARNCLARVLVRIVAPKIKKVNSAAARELLREALVRSNYFNLTL